MKERRMKVALWCLSSALAVAVLLLCWMPVFPQDSGSVKTRDRRTIEAGMMWDSLYHAQFNGLIGLIEADKPLHRVGRYALASTADGSIVVLHTPSGLLGVVDVRSHTVSTFDVADSILTDLEMKSIIEARDWLLRDSTTDRTGVAGVMKRTADAAASLEAE